MEDNKKSYRGMQVNKSLMLFKGSIPRLNWSMAEGFFCWGWRGENILVSN